VDVELPAAEYNEAQLKGATLAALERREGVGRTLGMLKAMKEAQVSFGRIALASAGRTRLGSKACLGVSVAKQLCPQDGPEQLPFSWQLSSCGPIQRTLNYSPLTQFRFSDIFPSVCDSRKWL
jgi:hypothetical protein